MIYRAIGSAELSPALFAHFDRRQEVTLCYRRAADGSWCVRPDPFTDDWDAADYAFLVQCLRRTAVRGRCGSRTQQKGLPEQSFFDFGFK